MTKLLECANCCAPIIGDVEYGIHDTPDMDGGEAALCEGCGGHEFPRTETIWHNIAQRKARGEQLSYL